MRVPNLIYECLPHLYVGVGAACVVGLPNVGPVGGVLLIVSGIAISSMRERYRCKMARLKGFGFRRVVPIEQEAK